MSNEPRLVVVLIGDLQRQPSTQVKYGLFLQALAERFTLVKVIDATLSGFPRLLNALRVFHPSLHTWKERYYKNIPAFRARSERVAARLKRLSGQADVVLQIGVLFDTCWQPLLPGVIYTDYTAQLSARQPEVGRSPFNPGQRQTWIGLERQAMQRATHVFTRADFVRLAILQDYGLPNEKVTSIGGGVNLPVMPGPQVRDPNQPPTSLFIGADFFRKGGDTLLQAFSLVHQSIPNARLLMLARGPHPADVPPGVEWITPTWDRTVIESLYRRANLFILPSRLETWGDVLLEAMAYGLPCIGVRGGAMEEIIQDGVTGLLVKSADPTELASAMVRLMTNEQLSLDWGTAARQRVAENFTWQKVAERLAPIIHASTNPQ